MYQERDGDLFQSGSHALVNTVNCVGIMGKGIALTFKQRYPTMFARYVQDCRQGLYVPGTVMWHRNAEDLRILNFVVKDHWCNPSRYEWVESCLIAFVEGYERHGIQSAAFPWIGAMNGQLDFHRVQAMMRHHLRPLPIPITVYTFK